MKKTLLLVFSAAILFCANSAKAQTAGVSSSSAVTTDVTTTTTGITDGAGTIRPLGGEWTVTVIVSDINGHGILGALVAASCTGLGSQYTNSTGTATWSGTGGCPCTAANAHITTTGCDKTVKVSCGTTLVTCP